MGKPKFSRKKYETPSHPWQEDRIKTENELIKKYGLKNKREIWKAQTSLKKYRGQARELLAKVQTGDIQSKKESDQLLMHLSRMNILPQNSTLDDVLALDTESILSRRLQTQTFLKGLSSTPEQARQLIAHGHIAIGEKRVTVPGYFVTKDEEGEIGYTKDSPLNDAMHPARPKADYRSTSIVKKTKDEPKEKVEKVQEDKTQKEQTSEEKKPEEPKEEPTKEQTPAEDKPEKTEEVTPKAPEEDSTKPNEEEKSEEKPSKEDENKKEGD